MKGSAIGLLMYLAVAVAPLPSHADGRAEGGGTWEDRGEEGEGGEGIGRHAGRSLQQVWNPLASGSGATKPVKRRAAAGPVKYGQFDKPNMCMGAPLPWRPFAKGGIGDLHAQGLYTEPSKPARAAKKRPLPKSKPASVGMEARTGDGSAEQGEGGETGMDAGGEGAKSDGESDAEEETGMSGVASGEPSQEEGDDAVSDAEEIEEEVEGAQDLGAQDGEGDGEGDDARRRSLLFAALFNQKAKDDVPEVGAKARPKPPAPTPARAAQGGNFPFYKPKADPVAAAAAGGGGGEKDQKDPMAGPDGAAASKPRIKRPFNANTIIFSPKRTRGASWGQWSPTPWCSKEKARPRMREGDQYLRNCLLSDKGCNPAHEKTIRAAAASLPSMRFLNTKPKCFSVTRERPCSRMNNNPDSYLGKASFAANLKPRRDLSRMGSCALVSNGPLSKVRTNGRAIDKHSQVWRFNAKGVGSMTPYIGRKTTVRVFNRPRGSEAACGRLTGCSRGRKQSQMKAGKELWMFWNYESAGDFPAVAQAYSGVDPRAFAGDLSMFIYKVYFTARRDMYRLGIKGFNCPKSISSGIHAAIAAVPMCRGTVDLFGFTYSAETMKSRSGHAGGNHKMFSGHSWKFDYTFMRLLHLAGKAKVCTMDDPSLSTSALFSRKG